MLRRDQTARMYNDGQHWRLDSERHSPAHLILASDGEDEKLYSGLCEEKAESTERARHSSIRNSENETRPLNCRLARRLGLLLELHVDRKDGQRLSAPHLDDVLAVACWSSPTRSRHERGCGSCDVGRGCRRSSFTSCTILGVGRALKQRRGRLGLRLVVQGWAGRSRPPSAMTTPAGSRSERRCRRVETCDPSLEGPFGEVGEDDDDE